MKRNRTRSEKLLDEVTEKITKAGLEKEKPYIEFVKFVKTNSRLINSYANTTFLEMVKKRQAVKYANMSTAQFNEIMKKYVDEQKRIFEFGRTLSEDDVTFIRETQEKAAKTRRDRREAAEIEHALQDHIEYKANDDGD